MKSFFIHKFLVVMSILGIACIVTSCHDEEVANIEELSYRHGYEYNFVKTFGEIDPNQTWDFSSYARRKMDNVFTRAEGDNNFGVQLDDEGYYHLPNNVNHWIFKEVCEERGQGNNKKRVIKDSYWHAFSFEADPTDVFDMYPIYLGHSECAFTFNMRVVDNDGSILYDSDVDDPDHGLWSTQDPNNGIEVASQKDGPWKSIVGSPGSGNHGSTVEAHFIRSKSFRIDFSDEKYGVTEPNTTVYFYIKILIHHEGLNEDGNILTSITDLPNIVCIDYPSEFDVLSNNEGYNCMFLGCEAGNKDVLKNGRADFDYNDLMFLMVGRTPNLYYDEMLQTTTIKKRYMIEDLTGFDFDFNDIVVDLTDISVHHYKIDEGNGIKEEEPIEYNGVSYPTVKQDAAFVYCCGTLPFQVKIGEKEFNRVTDPTDQVNTYKQLSGSSDANNTKVTQLGAETGIEPGYVYTYTYSYTENDPTPSPFWNPATNNISATIWTERKLNGTTDSSAGVDGPWAWVSNFPNSGDVPFIIATDQSVNWSPELTHVDFNWLGGDMSTDNSYEVTVVPITTTTNP